MSHHPFLTPSPYEIDAQNLIGRHPAEISAKEWQEHMPEAAFCYGLKAIRHKCLDCCAGNASEVRKCVSLDCPLWPLRMGRNPTPLRDARSQSGGFPTDEDSLETKNDDLADTAYGDIEAP